jgi:hypothetical protein
MIAETVKIFFLHFVYFLVFTRPEQECNERKLFLFFYEDFYIRHFWELRNIVQQKALRWTAI